MKTTLARTGRLRVIVNLGNPVLAQGTPDAPFGVTVDLAEDLASTFDLPLHIECVDSARKAYEAMVEGRSDLCFLAIEPAREEGVIFTPPYVSIDGVYVVNRDSSMDDAEDVDRPGVRIGVREGSAYDLFLTRTLNHAVIVRADEGTHVYERDDLEVCAGIRQPMSAYAKATDRRVLEPPFMQINQAVGLPRSTSAADVSAVVDRIEHLKANGFIAASLSRSGVDATVAPAAH